MAFGLPTANLEVAKVIDVLPGTYVGKTKVGTECFNSVIYIGPQSSERAEVHLFGFFGDLYGQILEVEILQLVSSHIPWESEEQMKAKVANDVQLAEDYFKT